MYGAYWSVCRSREISRRRSPRQVVMPINPLTHGRYTVVRRRLHGNLMRRCAVRTHARYTQIQEDYFYGTNLLDRVSRLSMYRDGADTPMVNVHRKACLTKFN